jgi:prepilin-type processing-associated H-X9-DG protein
MLMSWHVAKKGGNRPLAKAFSFIELLMVTAIIMVLVALLMPAVNTAREQARKGKCASNMRQFGISFRLYQADHKGMYPDPWVNNSDNWQSFLSGAIPVAPWIGPNVYVPSEWQTYNAGLGGAKRLDPRAYCPTIVKTYSIAGAHDQWGYTINATRTEISYGANGWPWFFAQHMNADLDQLFPKSGISAVMTCGNTASWNSDNDWNAFTSADVNDWYVRPIHGDIANVLFMDGHVEGLDVTTTEGKNHFNFFWYNAIPSTMANPW